MAACGRLKPTPVKDVADASVGWPAPADIGILVLMKVSPRDRVPCEAPLMESMDGDGETPTLLLPKRRREAYVEL